MNNKIRFLIVEDDEMIRLIHKDFLGDLYPECDIIEAENGAQGICHYFESRPDIILLDMMMPIMGGEAFLDILEEGHQTNILKDKPKIIVVTAIKDVKELMSIGKRFAVEAVISKPLVQTQLKSLLQDWIPKNE
ncbi:MAG: two-component system, unclassified family, response regulator [Candidatus Magnetoglobus multicellularis str. Araruama]|uniref:Two-component system, unclassified family, response regulator n=1 Tax=Candidatus Magnetoglobus multicellularis str. Araruama TaxID=890399 RepID=A0A1V1P9H0_9BACT|nr:MAG: two-component system, unclassified family, response regulator [Candidatus Magnetoglobus multicellularis str. Araruama]